MLANRQPDSADPSQWAYEIKHEGFRLVAVEHGTILSVGEMILSYVSPDARFREVSRALLSALENRAAERGNMWCTLSSTETARRFYQANGYVEDGRLDGKFGTSRVTRYRSCLRRRILEPPPPGSQPIASCLISSTQSGPYWVHSRHAGSTPCARTRS